MKCRIARNNIFANPGSVGVIPRRCASSHYLGETMVETDAVNTLAQNFSQTFGYVQLIGKNDRTWAWAPPQNGIARIKPGEYTLTVSCEDPFRRKIAAKGQ